MDTIAVNCPNPEKSIQYAKNIILKNSSLASNFRYITTYLNTTKKNKSVKKLIDPMLGLRMLENGNKKNKNDTQCFELLKKNTARLNPAKA